MSWIAEVLEAASQEPGAFPATEASSRERKPARPPRSGDICPNCGTGCLDYDGLLNLSCPVCGYLAGAGSCFS